MEALDDHAPLEQDLDADMSSGRGSPAPSLYSFHSSLDGRVMVRPYCCKDCFPFDLAWISCVTCMVAS